jgi:ADP-ribosylation factor-binding protein GGA
MEEEEKAAQSAKLQELIRRGGPEELQEANRLMKIMAGYDTRTKTDYRAKAAEEVGKIQQKARLLEERLAGFQPGDTMTEGDVYEELASALQSAHPKIQKMCEEESDDHEAVAKLLEINDSIHRTVERYKLMKKGDVAAASKIAKGTLGTSTGVSKGADNELSLIDFDADAAAMNGGPSADAQPGGLEDDLLGLSMGGSNYGQGGGISLGFGANTNLPGLELLSSTTQNSTARASTPTLVAAPVLPKPNYSPFSGFGTPQQTPVASPAPSLFQQQAAAQSAKVAKSTVDPFAALNSPPQQSITQKPPQPRSMFDFGPAPTPPPASTAAPAPEDDDEWAFSSALPEGNGLPSANDISVTDSEALRIALHATRTSPSDLAITMTVKFSNKSAQAISELTFQVAVTKVS